MTLSQLADDIGCHKSTVSRAARRLGVGRLDGQSIRLTAAECRRIKSHLQSTRPGNPNAAVDGARAAKRRR